MKLIGENLHIISKKTREAIENKDALFISELIKRQSETDVDWIDLNIGPARRGWEGTMEWLVKLATDITDKPLSFDTTNYSEMESGLKLIKNPERCIINSASADEERLNNMLKLASTYDTHLIALTLSDATGIPKEADARLEIAFSIMEAKEEYGVANEKILFDPLVLPLSVDQTQATEALNAIRMFKESFDPPVLTTIGLSNVSNGSPKENRPLINLVFAVMAMGCGLDSAIVDAFDSELLRVNKMIETLVPEKNYDELLIKLFNMSQEFGELEDISYNSDNKDEVAIYKTAEALLNKNVYSHNYLSI